MAEVFKCVKLESGQHKKDTGLNGSFHYSHTCMSTCYQINNVKFGFYFESNAEIDYSAVLK